MLDHSRSRPAAPDDLNAVLTLLRNSDLPEAGVDEWIDTFRLVEEDGHIVAAAGFEIYERNGLLRSVVVDPAHRGAGLANTLVQDLLEQARADGLDAIYLLTTTAENYFPRFGFERVTRDHVPQAVKQSVEFKEACPASAAVMALKLR